MKRVTGSIVAAILSASLLAGCGSAASSGAACSENSHPSTEPSSLVQPAVRLASVDNFRDVAGDGAGYLTAGGKHVKRGVLYRSNALEASPADQQTLDSLHITTIYDLRTTSEIKKHPDVPVTGAKTVYLNIFGDGPNAATGKDYSTVAHAAAILIDGNQRYVTYPNQRATLKQLFTDIADTDGVQIMHCTSGKDRTGWTSAILLSILGVDRATIMSDYLLTNKYSAATITKLADDAAASGGPEAGLAMRKLMGVSPEFLQAGFDQITRTYGSVDNYVTQGIGLSPETIAKLKAKLTV